MQAPTVILNRSNVSIWIAGAVGLLVVGMLIAGLDLWYQSYYYASTDNALVTGEFIQIGAPGPARVAELDVRVGDYVERGEALATIHIASSSSSAGPTTTTSLRLRAPRASTVVSLPVREGQLVSAGQPVVVLADPDALWVVANMDENSLKGVQPGQKAEVTVSILDRTLVGRVAEITPEFSPTTQGTNGRTRTTSFVPVKVEFEGNPEGLQPGMTAYVKIRIR